MLSNCEKRLEIEKQLAEVPAVELESRSE